MIVAYRLKAGGLFVARRWHQAREEDCREIYGVRKKMAERREGDTVGERIRSERLHFIVTSLGRSRDSPMPQGPEVEVIRLGMLDASNRTTLATTYFEAAR